MDNVAPNINLEEAIERMGDKEIYIEIAQFFAGHLLQSVNDIESCFNNGNLTEATRLVHSMKSNCATVGADSLRERCYTVEMLGRSGDLAAARDAFAALKPDLVALPAVLLAVK